MLKEFGRKSVLLLCLTVGLLAGGVFNLSARVEQNCAWQYENEEGHTCWTGGECEDCDIYWNDYTDLYDHCEYVVHFCKSQ